MCWRFFTFFNVVRISGRVNHVLYILTFYIFHLPPLKKKKIISTSIIVLEKSVQEYTLMTGGQSLDLSLRSIIGDPFLLSNMFFTTRQINFSFSRCMFQVSVTKKYPAVIVIVFFQVFFITIQTGVYALIVVRDQSAWELKLDMGLIVILYQVIIIYYCL